MSKNPNGQVGDGSDVRPRSLNDTAIVPPDRSRGLGSPPPGRDPRCLARAARGAPRRHPGDGQGGPEEVEAEPLIRLAYGIFAPWLNVLVPILCHRVDAWLADRSRSRCQRGQLCA
jgi:hypothetical protein